MYSLLMRLFVEFIFVISIFIFSNLFSVYKTKIHFINFSPFPILYQIYQNSLWYYFYILINALPHGWDIKF
jgi:hypothetical protein